MITINEALTPWLLLAGKLCLVTPFVVSGIHKLFWYGKAVAEFRADGVPMIPVTLPATIVLHLAGPACILAGVFVTGAALLLAAFTLAATIQVHRFWTMQGQQRLIISRVATANLAVVGGFLVLATIGA